ncbi:MAG: NADP-dependent oxidoreductase [Deltaproteobacteria bacterium]|nr:NADP-dependent oxidoreductase [Kofleriaceae bacterium]
MSTRPTRNRQFRLASRPEGKVQRSNFDAVDGDVPSPGAGQLLVRTKYLSLDPTNRVWMQDIEQYLPPVQIGEVMRGVGLGEVIESQHPDFKAGDLVIGMVGWQEVAVLDGGGPNKPTRLPPGLPFPEPAFLGALGVTGITAYFGLLELGKPKAGETVVVSAAAGAVGSVAGQIAKLQGCRVVGIAGSADKCAWLTGELGFDAAICYRDADWKEQLRAACPEGIDVDFENVGGDIMSTVLAGMNLHGRVVLCGLISGYNTGKRMLGPFDTVLMKRLTVSGFIILDYAPRFMEAVMQLGQWMMQGKLRHADTIVDGLDAAPEALNMLFDGGNRGKLLVRVAVSQ